MTTPVVAPLESKSAEPGFAAGQLTLPAVDPFNVRLKLPRGAGIAFLDVLARLVTPGGGGTPGLAGDAFLATYILSWKNPAGIPTIFSCAQLTSANDPSMAGATFAASGMVNPEAALLSLDLSGIASGAGAVIACEVALLSLAVL
jgi:hypothetical protein